MPNNHPPSPTQPHQIEQHTVSIGVLTNLQSLGIDTEMQIQVSPTQAVKVKPDYPLIATCAHVVHFAPGIIVETSNGDRAQALVIAIDTQADVALLYPIKVNATPSFNTPAIVGDSSAILNGAEVWAVGGPLGVELKFSLTYGKISYLSRPAPRGPDGKVMTYLKAFQMQTPIKPGNSGGILTDENGHWIGMNYAGLMTQAKNDMGINFSLHVNDVVLVLRRLIKTGAVIRPGLQIGIRPVTDADSQICAFVQNNILRNDGVFIDYVKKGSPSAQHFQAKDIILQVNGDIIKDLSDFRYAIYKAAGKNSPVAFRIWRNGQEIPAFDLNVPSIERPFNHTVQLDFLGMSVIDSSVDDGVTVMAVSPNSIAGSAGIITDAVISGIEDPMNLGKFIPTDSVTDFYTAIQQHFVNGNVAFYLELEHKNKRTTIVPIIVPPAIAAQILQQFGGS